jgi:hypothetical protein
MARTVTIDLVTTKQSFSSSVQFDSIFVVLSPAILGNDIFGSGSDVRSAFSAPYSVAFENVVAGDYNITAYARDFEGNPLGAKITGMVTIAEDILAAATPSDVEVKSETIDLDVPVSFTVTVS